MTWLDKSIKSSEVVESVATGVEEIASVVSDKYFEMDDDTTGVDIDGYLFFPKSVDGDESFSHREFIRTKIMSGGEFVTRGQYIPKEFSFDTVIDIEPEHLDEYLNIFNIMENKVCRVTSPYMGGMFNAEVNISVTNPESSPHVIECKVKIKEIPNTMVKLKGDPVIKYPSVNTVSDVKVKDRGTKKPTDDKVHKDIYDDYNSSESSEF